MDAAAHEGLPAQGRGALQVEHKEALLVVVGNFLMCYAATDLCIGPRECGASTTAALGWSSVWGWASDGVPLRGKREFVLTARSSTSSRAGTRRCSARGASVKQHDELDYHQGRAAAAARGDDSTLIELETTKSKLREERDPRHRGQLEAEATKEDASEVARGRAAG